MNYQAQASSESINDEPLITEKQLLERYPVSRNTLRRRRKNGDIPYIQDCGRILYLWSQVSEAISRKFGKNSLKF